MFKRVIARGTIKAFWKRLWFTIGKPAFAGLLVLILVSYLWGEGELFSLQRLFSFRPTLTGALNNALLVKVLLTITIGIAAFMYLGKKYGEHLRKLPLFAAIVAWVLLSLIAFTTVGWLWSKGGQPYLSWGRFFTIWRPESAPSKPEEFLPAALAIVGGIGAVGYLVIKYRERSGEERTEAEELIQKAVEQLGSESDQVRIAGVYALTNIADTYRGQYKQRVVDILCGYLRTKRGKFVERKPEKTLIEDADVNTTGTDATIVYESDDGPVESTILEVLATHFRKQGAPATLSAVSPELSWSDCKLDLHGAHFIEKVKFAHCTFRTQAIFEKCHFQEWVSLANCTFHGIANFSHSTFQGDAHFKESTFERSTSFLLCKFKSAANFQSSTFRDVVEFKGSSFLGWFNTVDANFCTHADFTSARFANETEFTKVIFHSQATFEKCTFSKGVKFTYCTLRGGVILNDSKFEGLFQFAGNASPHDFSFNGCVLKHATHREYEKRHKKSPLDQLLSGDSILPWGARWDDEPVPSDEETELEDSPPDGDTALPDGH